jgi:DNA-binding response OmpR family regulator
MTSNSSTTTPIQLLVIEDDAIIAEAIATELELEGFQVHVEHNGLTGLTAARQRQPDLIVLDRMLPGIDGLEICRRLRQSSNVPIIMVTALDRPEDRVEGLNLGASDYLGKPFLLEELIARIHAQLRLVTPPPRTMLTFADLTLDVDAHEVRRGDQALTLTPKEFDLLQYLMQHPRQVKSREQIVESVWGYTYEGDSNVVDVYIRYLRSKLDLPDHGRLIHTVRGVGYILKEEDTPDGDS